MVVGLVWTCRCGTGVDLWWLWEYCARMIVGLNHQPKNLSLDVLRARM